MSIRTSSRVIIWSVLAIVAVVLSPLPAHAELESWQTTRFAMTLGDPVASSPPNSATLQAPAFVASGTTAQMWSCVQGEGSMHNYIAYNSSSTSGRSWSDRPSWVLRPTVGDPDQRGVCNPSVVKIGSYYYMAYDGWRMPLSGEPYGRQVFAARATSPLGPWSKWDIGWGPGGPWPVVTFGSLNSWGAGAPSLVVKDGTVYLFYRYDNETRVQTAPATDGWPGRLGPATRVTGASVGLEVKYDESSSSFVAVTSLGGTHAFRSANGVAFTPLDVEGHPYFGDTVGLSGDGSGQIRTADDVFLGTTAHERLTRADVWVGDRLEGYFRDSFESGPDHWDTYGGTWGMVGGAFEQSDIGVLATATSRATLFGDATYRMDVDLLDSATAADWLGMHIAKEEADDTFSQSGYLIYLRENGSLEVWKAGKGVVATAASGIDPLTAGTTVIRVVKSGANLKVFVNWSDTPKINWTDGAFPWGPGYTSLVTNRTMASWSWVEFAENARDDFAGTTSWSPGAGTWTQGQDGGYLQDALVPSARSTARRFVAGDGRFHTRVSLLQVKDGDLSNWAGLQICLNSPGDSFGSSGYLVFIRADGRLGLYDPSLGLVADVPTSANMSQPVDLDVVKTGTNIKVYVNGSTTPSINWSDPGTFYWSGYTALAAYNSRALFQSFSWEAS